MAGQVYYATIGAIEHSCRWGNLRSRKALQNQRLEPFSRLFTTGLLVLPSLIRGLSPIKIIIEYARLPFNDHAAVRILPSLPAPFQKEHPCSMLLYVNSRIVSPRH